MPSDVRESDVKTSPTDDAFLDHLQHAAFTYFLEYAHPATGLIADTSRVDSPCSISVVGFGLSSLTVGVERGWIPRGDAAARTLQVLRFLNGAVQSDARDATGYKGFFYHFLDMTSGRRVWDCELSVIDSTLLMAGILLARSYFAHDDDAEVEIRAVADNLYARVDWNWARNSGETVAQGWKPESGFLHAGWEGYNEALLLYVLSLASPTHPLPAEAFGAWTGTYQWESIYGYDLLYGGPLFVHLFSHAWLDLRGIRDAFMREKDSDYFENTCRTVAMQREYAVRNPNNCVGYGLDLWGITAGDGPGNEHLREGEDDRRFFGYTERGIPFGRDDGTIAPWTMAAALPFAPTDALRSVRALLAHHPGTVRAGRFVSGYNPSLLDQGGWISPGVFGLDQGIVVMMLENYRSGLIWKLMRNCEPVARGLKLAGFEGGWLADA